MGAWESYQHPCIPRVLCLNPFIITREATAARNVGSFLLNTLLACAAQDSLCHTLITPSKTAAKPDPSGTERAGAMGRGGLLAGLRMMAGACCSLTQLGQVVVGVRLQFTSLGYRRQRGAKT